MDREGALRRVAEAIVAVEAPHPVRVAVDGPDAAGKTVLADELVPHVERSGRAVIRASVDGFHRPRAERLRRGDESPEGYYLDSFDYRALRAELLDPLGPGGDRRYRRAVFDFRTDTPVSAPVAVAPADAVLLFDGVFLQRRELAGCWDFRIFVFVPLEEAQRRALSRDVLLFGSEAQVRRRYARRYVPGQRLYDESVRPDLAADVVIDNTFPAEPTIRMRAAASELGRS